MRTLTSATAVLLTAAALLSPGTASAEATAPDASAAAAALVWSDEFDGPPGAAPDPANWNHETGNHGWGNNELQNYTDSRPTPPWTATATW